MSTRRGLRRFSSSLPWALGLATALSFGVPLHAAEAAKAEAYDHEYMLRALSQHEAEVLIWEQCPKPADSPCRVRGAGFRDGALTVAVLADEATHAKIARVLAENDGVPATHAFQVVLLLADRQAGGLPADLPANCRKAVEDVKGFLPFTRYRMLDAGLLRTTQQGKLMLSGLAGSPVEVELRVRDHAGDQLSVDVFKVGIPGVVMQTAFGIKIGETLVVGTSKLNGGDEALVALVSALE